jgi:mannose-6-phosphate isomerase-like protein (cupin superfamily)
VIIRMGEVAPFDFGGLVIRDYTAGQQLSSSIAVPPGSIHPAAMSLRSDKYYFVVSGSVEFVHDGKACVLAAGDSCLVPLGRRFAYRNVGDEPAARCLVHTPRFDSGAELFVQDERPGWTSASTQMNRPCEVFSARTVRGAGLLIMRHTLTAIGIERRTGWLP